MLAQSREYALNTPERLFVSWIRPSDAHFTRRLVFAPYGLSHHPQLLLLVYFRQITHRRIGDNQTGENPGINSYLAFA